MLSGKSKKQDMVQDSANNLVELLRLQAMRLPNKKAYHFVLGRGKDIPSLSYEELYKRARALAVTLVDNGVKDQRVILLCKPSLEYIVSFWGCILAGAIAVPAYPPVIGRLSKTLPRLEAIMEDCQASIALASSDLICASSELAEHAEVFKDIQWIDMDNLDLKAVDRWQSPKIDACDIAFLQYTSGSTSLPKGVMINHHNLLHNSRAIFEVIGRQCHTVSWLPPYHDMGLIGNIIQVVYSGGWGYFMAPATFLRYPDLWLSTIAKTKANVSVAPNFGYEHCLSKVTDKQLQSLDLSHWMHALSGAEPIKASTLNDFSKRFSQVGFNARSYHPCYGLAESTLMVSGGRPTQGLRTLTLSSADLEHRKVTELEKNHKHGLESVACGKAVDSTDIVIVNPDTRARLGKNRIGEIWVHSPSVATGYWNKPEINEVIFHATIEGEGTIAYLRTGDLGFIDADEELHVSGRIKDLIVLQGRNLYPSDIETIAQGAYLGKKLKTIAFSIDVLGEEKLIVVMEAVNTDKNTAAELVSRVRSILSEEPLLLTPYAVIVVRSGQIPLTTSGKIQRHVAKKRFLSIEYKPFFASISSHFSSTNEHAIEITKEDVLKELYRYTDLVEIDEKASLVDCAVSFLQLVNVIESLQKKQGRRISLSTFLMNPNIEQFFSLVLNAEVLPIGDSRDIQKNELQDWLIDFLSTKLDLPKKLINLDLPFVSLGLDSAGSIELAQSISKYMSMDIPDTLVWEAPSLRIAIDHLMNLQSENGKREKNIYDKIEAKDFSQNRDEPIAIIGMGCRFPGANDVEEFWKLLQDGRDAISLTPSDRWPDYQYSETKNGKPISDWGGYLDQIDEFDPLFFGLSYREAEKMDPQQRLLLEVSWQALEHACIDPKSLAGTETGVYVGIGSQEYGTLQAGDEQNLDLYSCTGSSQAIAANRISYLMDFHGPSMTIDTACSGALVSVHLASEGLKRGESDMALAAGVNLIIKPDLTVAFSDANMLSPSGHCNTFDDDANGYVRGEGCGVVVLQRLSDAIKDKHNILGILEGSAVAHNGKSNGLTAPSSRAQESLIRRVLNKSGVKAGDIDYVEAHGTGTPLGDPIEANVLAKVYGRNRNNEHPCFIGSVKTNIGHLEAAAGIAGLIKSVLCLQKNYIPSHLNFIKPSTKVNWKNSGLQVASKASQWGTENNKKRYSALSSFGFGGAISHAILSSYKEEKDVEVSNNKKVSDWKLLVLSAREKTTLKKHADNILHHLDNAEEKNLNDICYTAAVCRSSQEERIAVVGKNKAQLIDALSQKMKHWAVEEADESTIRGKTVFCYSGQGSQYLHMAPSLLKTEPVFAEVIDRCDRLLVGNMTHSLVDLLSHHTLTETLQETKVLQPILYSLQCALTALWRSWGVSPDIVLGHSLGEYAAMQAAGVFSLEQGLLLVKTRAKAMAEQTTKGAMAACVGDISEIEKILAEYQGKLWVAAYNSPNNLVVSGHQKAIASLMSESNPRLTVKLLSVSNAFHSPLIEGAKDSLISAASRMVFQRPKVPLISNIHGTFLTHAPSPEYFSDHLCQPVNFLKSINTAISEGGETFFELGPGRSLLNMIRVIANEKKAKCIGLPSLMESSPEMKCLFESLSTHWEHSGEVNWNNVYQHQQRRRIFMPNTPFNRTKLWHDSVSNRNYSEPVSSATTNIDAALDLFRSQSSVLEKLLAGDTSVSHVKNMSSLRPISREKPLNIDNEKDREEDNIAESVKHLVAKISGAKLSDISLSDTLNSRLGLDSLMRTELDRLLTLNWPKLSNIDRSSLGEDPSLQDIVQFVEKFTHGTIPVDVRKENQIVELHQKGTTIKTVVPETNFEDSEEYKNHIARYEYVNSIGENPYNRIHEGFNGAHSTLDGEKVINFSSFNYSSLSNHPVVNAAAIDAINTYGTSPSATPLLFGETPLHRELEAEIASYMGTEASVVFASGHSTSVAVIGHVMGPEDLVIHDQYIHDCAIRGAIMSGAKRRSFSHDDWQELDSILSRVRGDYRRVLIIIEGVYSQDGDIGSLPEFIAIKKKHECLLMIDEAHSIGVLGHTGAGAGEYFDVDRKDVDIWMGTLSKGLGSCGGYIAGTENFIQYLKFTTPLIIFSTGISPANAAAALASIQVLRKSPELVKKLHDNSTWFLLRAKLLGFDTGPSFDSPVIPIIVGSWEKSMMLSSMLKDKGINVMPIGYPAVEKDKCRLRFFMNVDHKQSELEFTLQTLKTAITELDKSQAPDMIA